MRTFNTRFDEARRARLIYPSPPLRSISRLSDDLQAKPLNGFLSIGSVDKDFIGGQLPEVLRRAGISPEPFDLKGRSATCLWGDSCGDVRRASASSGSVLIAHGYFTEVPGFSDPADQRGVVEFLLARLEQGPSLEEVAELSSALNGSFAIVYRDALRSRTLCIADRVASRPLWLTRFGDDWALSSNPFALALACGIRKLDCGSLVSRLLYGGPVDPEKSLFDRIDGIGPGCALELGQSGGRRCCVWHRFQHEADESRSTGAWADLVSQRLVRSAERIGRVHPSPTLFFSGGVDSRLIAAALVAAGSPPKAVTLGDSVNLEVKIAAAAARALGLEHQVVLRDPHWYLRGLERSVFECGGSFLWIHAHFSQVALAAQRAGGTNSFLLGDFAEAFSKLCCSADVVGETQLDSGEFLARFDDLPLPLYRPQNRELTLSLLSPDIRAVGERILKERIVERYEGLSGSSRDPLIVVDQFFRWHSAATIATFAMFLDLRSAASECNLMFDNEMHDVLQVLPSRIRQEANFGVRLISKLNRLAGWVPNSNSLLPACFPPAAHRLAKQCKPLFGRARRLILGSSHRTTGSWPKTAVLYAQDAEWRRTFDSLLCESNDLFDEFFDREAVRRCWADFLNGDVRRAGDVEQLVDLALLGRMQTGL